MIAFFFFYLINLSQLYISSCEIAASSPAEWVLIRLRTVSSGVSRAWAALWPRPAAVASLCVGEVQTANGETLHEARMSLLPNILLWLAAGPELEK